MFGLKIFVRVQTFRRGPPVLLCHFCHSGWVGSNVWDKVQKKTFFLHLPLLGWKIGSPSHVAYKEIGRGSLYWCTSCPPDGLAPLGRHVVSCLDKNILLSLCPHFVSVCATFWTPSSCALSHITQLCWLFQITVVVVVEREARKQYCYKSFQMFYAKLNNMIFWYK